MSLSPDQIELLYKASQTKFLTAQQRSKLSLSNPYTHTSRTAEIMQREVARLNPTQARLWAREANANMSLEAAAAAQGLTNLTPELQDEIERFNPQTDDEKRRNRIAELTKNNPYGELDSYETLTMPDGSERQVLKKGAAPHLTNALELESIAPELAAELKAQRIPKAPAHSFSDREAMLLRRHGYSVPE